MARIIVLSLCYDNRKLPQIANQGTFRWSNGGWMSSFCKALEDLGHDVIAFPDMRYSFMLGEENTNKDFYHLIMGFEPDYLITYKGDSIWYSTFVDIARELQGLQKIWWSVDDPYLLHHQSNEAELKMRLHDTAMTCCKSSMDDYANMGMDSKLFYPTVDPAIQNLPEILDYELTDEEKERYTCDIMLGGTCYNEQHNSRARICQSIIGAGLGDGLKLWGHEHWKDNNWTHGIDLSPYYFGRVDENDMPKIYHNSKIVINSWVNGGIDNKCGYPCKGYYNWRLFEAIGSGAFLLSEFQEDDEDWPFKDGEHLATWSTHDEMVDKAKYYLEHEDERRKIAMNGYKLAQEKFTWKKSLKTIFGGR